MAGFGDRLRALLNQGWTAHGAPLPHARARSGRSQSFPEDNNEFALAMYGRLAQRPGNLFFSPFSIRTALAMAQAGARGETAAQMREALCGSSAEATPDVALTEAVARLTAAGDGEYEVAVANSLWGQDGTPIEPGFLDLIARRYGGAMNTVDFRRGAEAARETINLWIEGRTRQKIRELISPGSLDDTTRLVVANAVYFKGTWVLKFRKAATREQPFHLDGGGMVKAPLMHQLVEIRYMQADGCQAIDLLYGGGDMSMLVLLPERKDGLGKLEARLSAQMLNDCMGHMSREVVELFLPRFKITWGAVNLKGPLTALGMTLPFDQLQADFSGINGHQPPNEEALFLSAVLHKAFAEVNEEGTEAAAATALTFPVGASFESSTPPVPTFRADHPFLFAIRDRRSGAILFLGRVADPTAEN